MVTKHDSLQAQERVGKPLELVSLRSRILIFSSWANAIIFSQNSCSTRKMFLYFMVNLQVIFV
jgi:hypothetical protein